MKMVFLCISAILFVSSATAMDFEPYTYNQDFETHDKLEQAILF